MKKKNFFMKSFIKNKKKFFYEKFYKKQKKIKKIIRLKRGKTVVYKRVARLGIAFWVCEKYASPMQLILDVDEYTTICCFDGKDLKKIKFEHQKEVE